MLTTSEFSLPADDLGPLGNAFDMIGRHRFGPRWTTDMARAVRLGQRSRDREKRARGNWAVKALTQCVENGWLPLVYFVGGRRVRYFDDSHGPTLHALYPQPTEDLEGQIELKGGDIHPCMVDASDLSDVLRRKFPKPSANRTGPRRNFLRFEEELDRYFNDHPLDTRGCEVIRDLGKILPEESMPSRASAYRLIYEATKRVQAHFLNAQSETNMRRTTLA
ncbi:hypothetical protein DFR49_1106 [Hephaestia caeni]|uniref:Uncharacterized protein n=1 Tax=Hephaestia caeni TaxID=645617 RepID=A0A397PKA2_9SPHN|nr:hypothetical protein [Hephaestia caeni]RIA46564.1 hypothetical protein DFR49_1106 [Hephaestia caeni]